MQGDSSLYLIPGRLIMPPKKLTSQRQWNWYRRWTASWFWNSKYTHITDVVGINSSLDELGHVRREVVLVNNFFPFGFIQYLQRKSKDDIWQPNLQTVNWKTISKKSDFQVRFCWNKIVSTEPRTQLFQEDEVKVGTGQKLGMSECFQSLLTSLSCLLLISACFCTGESVTEVNLVWSGCFL